MRLGATQRVETASLAVMLSNTVWKTVSCACVVAACQFSAGESTATAAEVDFTRDVQPILAANCLACHGFDAESREAGLRLDDAEAATAELDSGARAIVPGNPTASELVVRIESDDSDLVMPPPGSGHTLTAEQRETLRSWVEAGAPTPSTGPSSHSRTSHHRQPKHLAIPSTTSSPPSSPTQASRFHQKQLPRLCCVGCRST